MKKLLFNISKRCKSIKKKLLFKIFGLCPYRYERNNTCIRSGLDKKGRPTVKICLRRDNTENINKYDPVLLPGEPIVEFCDNGSIKLKIGDGERRVSELNYIGEGVGNIDDEELILKIKNLKISS